MGVVINTTPSFNFNQSKENFMDKKTSFVDKWSLIIYGIMMAGIMVICLFCNGMDYGRKEYCENFISPFILIPIGLVLLGLIYCICVRLKLPAKLNRNILLAVVSVFVFLIQIYAVRLYYFYTDWDVPELLNFSEAVVHNGDVAYFNGYYSKFSNNIFTAYMFCIIRKFFHMVKLHNYEVYGILCIQCLINTLTGAMLFKILERLTVNIRLAALGYVLYLFLVGMSPWVSIPYSDSMALMFPTIILLIYTYRDKLEIEVISWILMSAIAVFGYKTKPQTFIVFIAIVIVEVYGGVRERRLKKLLTGVIGAFLGIVMAVILTNLAVSSTHVEIDKELTYNIQHYIMLGLNDETGGVYSREDANFSGSFDTAKERNEADIKVAGERLNSLGAFGLGRLAVRKILTNYYNGTFCWGGEGEFFVGIMEPRNLPLSDFFRGIYYSGDYSDVGKYYDIWSNFEQMIWLAILFVGIFAIFGLKSPEKSVIALAVIGLTIFEIIFEARARYLYTYAPFYIILAVYGVMALQHLKGEKYGKQYQ